MVLLSLIPFMPRIRAMKPVGTGQSFISFLVDYERDSLAPSSHCFFLPSFSSSLHLCHCLQSIGQVIHFLFLKIVLETIYLRLEHEPTWQRLKSSQNPWCLVSGPNESQVLVSHCWKNSVRDTDIDKRYICSDSERNIPQSVGHHRRWLWQPWNVVWLVFMGWVISYGNEWEDHSNS